jgi:hypothetical protein
MAKGIQVRGGSLARMTEELKELRTNIGRDVFRMGCLLAQVREQELWRQGRFASFEAYVEAAVDISRSTAYRAIDVSRHFSESIAARYGPDKLAAGVAYLRATNDAERPGDLIAARLRLRAGDGKYVHKTFHQATAADVWDAVRLLAQSGRIQRAGVSRAFRAEIARLARRLPPAPRALGGRERIRVRRHAPSGKLYVWFAAVPIDAADELGHVLRELKSHASHDE